MLSVSRGASVAVLCGTFFLATAGVSHATAITTNSLSTQTDIAAGNNHVDPSNPDTYYEGYIARQNVTDNSTATSSYSGTFSGMNESGAAQTMTVSGSAKAKADYGVLKASSTLTITNPFYNSGNPVVSSDGATLDYSGVPDGLDAEAAPRFSDVLSVSGASPISELTFGFHLTGSISSNAGGDAFGAGLFVENGNSIINSEYLTGALDKMIYVSIPVSDPANVALSMALYSYSQAGLDRTYAYSDTGTYTVSSNFFDTLDLSSIMAYDASKNPVTLTGVTGLSGTNYLALTAPTPPTSGSPVPETPTLPLMMSALAGLFFLRRRKRA